MRALSFLLIFGIAASAAASEPRAGRTRAAPGAHRQAQASRPADPFEVICLKGFEKVCKSGRPAAAPATSDLPAAPAGSADDLPTRIAGEDGPAATAVSSMPAHGSTRGALRPTRSAWDAVPIWKAPSSS